MNEKEAREIAARWKDVLKETEDAIPLPSKIMKAVGYLEAIEKAKGLEEALRAQLESCSYPKRTCSYCEFGTKALAKWEKEK